MPAAEKAALHSPARETSMPYPSPRFGQREPDGYGSDPHDGVASGRANGKASGSGSGGDHKRHLSCENCRVRKMKCSRQSPCLSCRMRGDKCVWVGPAPNGSADEDELEQSQNEVNRLRKLVDLLLARLEEQDAAEHFRKRTGAAQFQPHPSILHGAGVSSSGAAERQHKQQDDERDGAPPERDEEHQSLNRSSALVRSGSGTSTTRGAPHPSTSSSAQPGDIPITPLNGQPSPGYGLSLAGLGSLHHYSIAVPHGAYHSSASDSHVSLAPASVAAAQGGAHAMMIAGAPPGSPAGTRIVYEGPKGEVWRAG
ncbi:uncharacterized protein JCM10292_001681 [Rhodotorula paludigena]|uniref:uncharacterized protein n=1 Tax=Rhodotorula paludigena TaxID=86838 RepID=UPI00316B39BB